MLFHQDFPPGNAVISSYPYLAMNCHVFHLEVQQRVTIIPLSPCFLFLFFFLILSYAIELGEYNFVNM